MDVMRGLLATWVVLHHVALIGGFSPDHYPWRILIRHGQEPVLVFFALSGFAITRSLWLRPQRWLSFLIARFWRIYPVYLMALLIGTGVVLYAQHAPRLFTALTAMGLLPWAADEGVPPGSHVLLHLLQLHGLMPSGWLPHADTSLVAPGWSLSTEFQFYVLAPLLIAVLLRPWSKGNWLPGILLLIAGLSRYFTHFALIAPANVLQYLDLFLLGMIGAVMPADRAGTRVGYCLLGGMVAVAGWHAGQVIVVTAVGVWLATWWCCGWRSVDRWLDTRVGRLMLYAGALSYPLYILHYPMARLLLIAGVAWVPPERMLFLLAWAPATIAASFLGAALLHRYVERPGTRYGKRLADRRERRLAARCAGGWADAVPAMLGRLAQACGLMVSAWPMTAHIQPLVGADGETTCRLAARADGGVPDQWSGQSDCPADVSTRGASRQCVPTMLGCGRADR